jgi:hypothetical protein
MDYTERKVQTLRFLNLLYDSVKGIADESQYVRSTEFAQKLNLNYAITMDQTAIVEQHIAQDMIELNHHPFEK